MLTKQELGRQILHIAVGLVTVVLIYSNILSPWSIFLLIIFGILASLICKYYPLWPFSLFLHYFEREDMKKRFPGKGLIFFFVGVLLAIQLFETKIALAAIMVLALGDSVSHIVGGRYGKLKNIFNGKSKKLLEGTVAGSIAGFLGALIFVPIPEAFFGAFAAMAAEVVEVELNQNQLDDNLLVPLVAGTVMLLISKFL